jgi:hypothetical protein
MKDTPRHLRKPEVEALLAAVAGPASSALEEATVLRFALDPVLRRVLAPEPDVPWGALVDAGAAQGAWSPARTALLRSAEHPDRAPDVEAVVEALWDLVTELNERRTIAPGA